MTLVPKEAMIDVYAGVGDADELPSAAQVECMDAAAFPVVPTQNGFGVGIEKPIGRCELDPLDCVDRRNGAEQLLGGEGVSREAKGETTTVGSWAHYHVLQDPTYALQLPPQHGERLTWHTKFWLPEPCKHAWRPSVDYVVEERWLDLVLGVERADCRYREAFVKQQSRGQGGIGGLVAWQRHRCRYGLTVGLRPYEARRVRLMGDLARSEYRVRLRAR